MKKQISVCLIDDHQVIRDGLRAMLGKEEDIVVRYESHGCDSDVSAIIHLNPDVVLMDISMGQCSGMDLTKKIIGVDKTIRIIILSMFHDEDSVMMAIDAGVSGYLSKNSAGSEIVNAIRTVASGKTYFNKEITDMMMQRFIEKRQVLSPDLGQPSLSCLTQRELETLKLFAQGLTNNEIADSLNISIRTVESHKTHIMQKLGFKTLVELVKFALRNKIADLN
jgi:two-component system, NarL family, response regulator NreC